MKHRINLKHKDDSCQHRATCISQPELLPLCGFSADDFTLTKSLPSKR